MARVAAAQSLNSPSHSGLHKAYINAKHEYGATGDGSTDDTAAIQAAINAADDADEGHVFLPPGDYKLTSALTLEGNAVRISGAKSMNPDQAVTGTRIFGSVNGPLIQRTTSASTLPFIIEDLTVHNTHNTGSCISLAGIESPGGVYRCYIRGHIGVTLGINTFQTAIHDCRFSLGGTTYAASIGITSVGHSSIRNFDISGYAQGILASGPASTIGPGRIETCGTGVYLGTGGDLFKGGVHDINFEANDTAVKIQEAGPTVLSGLQILATAGSPSGGSIYGINVDNTSTVTVVGCAGGGGHVTAGVNIPAAAQRDNLTFVGCSFDTWSITEHEDLTLINCTGTGVKNFTRAGVVATASLYAAGTANNGLLIIEDGGAGDRNLILYAGGERFRIDGGAAF